MANHKKCCLSLLLSKYDDDESLGNYDDGEDDVYDIEAAAESQRLTAFIRSSAIRSLSGLDGGLVDRRNARTDWKDFKRKNKHSLSMRMSVQIMNSKKKVQST